jgi:hypothetical protein
MQHLSTLIALISLSLAACGSTAEEPPGPGSDGGASGGGAAPGGMSGSVAGGSAAGGSAAGGSVAGGSAAGGSAAGGSAGSAAGGSVSAGGNAAGGGDGGGGAQAGSPPGGAGGGGGAAGAATGGSAGSGGAAANAGSAVCAGLNNGSGTTIPCATTSTGGAVCFSSATPVTLTYDNGMPVTNVAQVTGKGFTEEACVLLRSGAVHCGRHTMISSTPKVASGASMVSGGLNHACAIVGNKVSCWDSYAGDYTFGAETPVQVACYYHGCCAVTSGGKLGCWGENASGMHGTGDKGNVQATPVAPKTVPGKALYVGPGQDHLCAVFEGGKVQCWGEDWNKQLGGLGASVDPGVALVASGALAVVGGQFHTCVLMQGGTVRCSSANQTEGAGQEQGMLVDVPGITGATAITAGKHYSCARLANGSVSCWGTISGGATPATITGLTSGACR